MPPLPRRHWHEMTTLDFEALDKDRCVAVLPVGAIEQHGPHLPVYVDACLGEALIERALAKIPDDLPVTVLPMQAVGKSNEHLAFPGTLTLSAETLIRLWTEIGESVHRAGIRRLVILNAHGGQPQVVDIVARDLRVRLKMFVVALNWWHLDNGEGFFPRDELKHGIHGGALETSMMLHLRPDLVKMELAKNFVPVSKTLEGENRWLTLLGGVGFGWQAQDLHPDGTAGDATGASAELGRAMTERASTRIAELLEEVARYPLERVRDRAPQPGRKAAE